MQDSPTFKSRVLSIFRKPSEFSRLHQIVFVVVFVLVGYLTFHIFAASTLVTTLEAEQMTLPSGGKVVSDASASAGKAIVLLANGTASASVNFPSSVTSVTVKAKGQQCSGAPIMTVSVDGAAILSNTAVSSTSWASYTATPTTSLSTGTHTATASLTNYYKHGSSCARTLYLDVFYFYGSSTPPTPAPTVSLSASPSSVAVGTASTLTWTSTNASSCTASGAWSGSEPTSGSTSTGALNQNSTYTLTCSGTGGTATGSVTVSVISTGKVWNITPTSTPSLATAEQQAQPGDTILLSGVFTNVSLVPGVSGTATAPITYKGNATFDGAGPSGVAAITRNYLVFDGITFTNSNYINAPTGSNGVIVRGSHNTFTNCQFSHMDMQLIGASYNSITNNTWRYYVASYITDAAGVKQPQTTGDMLYIVANSATHVGSSNNLIQGNDMAYGGHSLIEVGNGFGWGVSANNEITGNKLSNPWYRDIALADDGAGTTVENNQILDANSVPTLYSTVAGKVGQLNTSSNAIQITGGKNFIVRNNTISNAVSTYGVINIISEYYAQSGTNYLVESQNNQIYGNTITSNHGAAAIGFVVYRLSTDPAATPSLTGNLIHDNTITGNGPSPYSQFAGTYHTFLYHASTYASPWTKLNGNSVYTNAVDAPGTSTYLADVTYNGTTTHQSMSLTQFQAFDPTHVYGNH